MREHRVQRFEPLGRLEQQRRSVTAARRRERDLRVQQLRPRLLELVQRSRFRHREQPQRRVGRAGLVLALRRRQRTLCPASRVGRQLGGALVKRRAGRQAAPRPRPAGRALQLGRDVLVEPARRLGAVPRAAIGIDVGVGGLGERAVDALAVLRRGPRRRPPNARAGGGSAPGRRARPGPRRSPAPPRRPRSRARRPRSTPAADRPPARPPRPGAAAASPAAAPPVAPGSAPRCDRSAPARRSGRTRPPARRASARAAAPATPAGCRASRHDPIAHALVERTRHHGLQQRLRITVVAARARRAPAGPRDALTAARAPRTPARPTRLPDDAPRT